MLRRWADVTARTTTSVSTVRVWVSFRILVLLHLPGGVGFVCLFLHECMEQGLIFLGAHQCDMC